MSEYDLSQESGRCAAELMAENGMFSLRVEPIDAALRRAYAAGQASVAGGSDLDRLVTLAEGHADWGNGTPSRIAAECASMLSALKAQAVKP